MGDFYLPGDQKLSYARIKQLWLNEGGNPALADIMVSIALAESGGHTGVVNDTPATGDYSVGLWQINYYGNLLLSRSHAYGTPAQLGSSPAAQAKAAISLAGNGSGLRNWSTYNNGAYRAHLGGAGSSSSSSGATGQPVDFPGGLGGLALGLPGFSWLIDKAGGVSGSVSSLASIAAVVVKAATWLADPHNWIRIGEVVGGAVAVYLGLKMLAEAGAGPVSSIAGLPVRAVDSTAGAAKSLAESIASKNAAAKAAQKAAAAKKAAAAEKAAAKAASQPPAHMLLRKGKADVRAT